MKIFVGNIPDGSTDDTIRSQFSDFGKIGDVAVVTERVTGKPRGFAFVTMPNDIEARAAIKAMNGRELDGRALNVNEARERKA